MKLKEMWSKILKGNRKIYSSEICLWLYLKKGFSGGSDGKESAMWETQVRSLGQADLLEKGMATHSSILAWRIPWREEPGGLQSMGSQRAIQLSDQHVNKLRFIY